MRKKIPYVPTKQKLFFTLLLIAISSKVFSQTTVFADDFSTNTSTTYTTAGAIGASAWSVTRSGNDWGGGRNTLLQQLELTNDVGGTANSSGWIFASTNTSSFSSLYNSILSSNTGLVTWTFNMRQIRTDPSGLSSGSYGAAFILAGTSTTNNNTGSGYAVVLGQSGNIDPIRLVRYSNGIQNTLTNLITSNTSGLTDFGAEYLSIKITYEPTSNTWELFLRNDGAAAFSNPSIGTLISQGMVVDNMNTNISLGVVGAWWQGGNTTTQTAFFDNVQVTITNPNIDISSSSPGVGYIYPNTTDNILHSIKLSVTAAGITLTGLTVSTSGTYVISDLTASPFKLYINSNNSLIGATQLGSAQLAVSSGGSISFTGLSQSILSGTTQYLLLTADITSSATINNNISITTTAFSDIAFSGTPAKTGADPVPAGNSQTIYYGASISNAGSPSPSNIAQSSTDNTILGFDITQVGSSAIDFTGITISNFGSATSADINNLRIVKDIDNSGDYSGGDIIVSSNSPSFGANMSFTIAGETGMVSNTHYLLIADVLIGATVGNTILVAITNNTDVILNGNITSAAPYSGYMQTIVNPTITSTSGDHFKSVDLNGNWSTTATWQSSLDGITSWHTATLVPTSSAKSIMISSGTIVTVNNNESAKVLMIEAGSTLIHNNTATLTIVNLTTAGTEFIIDGTYVLKGCQPVLSAGVNAVVNNSGVVRVDDNSGCATSDNFAQSTKVLFKTGSVFQWNTVQAFSTNNVTYFQGTGFANENPIFRITANLGFLGGNLPLTINGKLEATTGTSGNIRFRNAGAKIFRDGLGGNGKFTHQAGSGPFQISGSSAVIDGTVQINIDDATTVSNDFEILEGAFVTVSGSPTININSGSDLVINGIIKHQGAQPIFLLDGNLTVNGYIDAASTGTFSAGAGTTTLVNVSVGSNSLNNSDNAGTLKFTTGTNFLNTFKMNRVVSRSNPSVVLGTDVIANNLILTRGILATDNHLFTYNKTGSLTLPATYTDSYICTCNSSGNEITANGNNGFKINNVAGNSDQIFPVGTDFVSPNRMALNMNGVTTNDYTVVVGKGDIGSTPLPRVNRIWYVSQTYTAGATATMKLYFTKRDWSSYSFGSGQDEIEDGFIYSDPRLVQKDYSDLFVNTSTQSTVDVPDYTVTTYNTEIFGRYYLGISADYQGNKNGINDFTRFSVINMSDIILAVKLINFKAYQKGSDVRIEWSAFNEINVDHYEVEKSINGFSFIKIASINAFNSDNAVNYSKIDISPITGDNFYRIKAVDKNGSTTYTSVVLVNIGGTKTALSIYPNPVQGRMVNVQLTSLPKGRYELIMYNIAGQIIFSSRMEHTGSSSVESFILPSNISCGAYILKLFNERINFTNRVVIE